MELCSVKTFVLAIDIGIINLGYVFVEKTDSNLKVIECNKVNITNMKHNKISRCNCNLYHENCIPDYVDHFIQEHSNLFDQADIILIERQPPVGITNVQDLLFTRFRNKVKLISPNSVHKFFKMTKNDYETRKIESQQLTKSYLEKFDNFNDLVRQHDITDAMLLVMYYNATNKKLNKTDPLFGKWDKNYSIKVPAVKFVVDFEQFRFNLTFLQKGLS